MVNRKKRLFFLTAAAVLCLMAASCGSASDGFDGRMAEPPITLLLKNNLPDESITTKAVEWFSEQVEERTEGRVKIEVLNNADMGDGCACLEQLQYGGTDIVKADVSALGNFVEEFNVLGMPYIYEDPEHFWAVHNGPIGEELLRGAQMAELGMYGLTYYDGGSRCFYSSRGEIHSPGDLEGLDVRVQQSETALSMARALGARPVTADYSELYRTLQSKEADAAENSIVNYYAQAFYEVAPYFTEDNHTRSADVLVMSLESRKKLSEGDLLILDKTAEESCEYQRKLWAEEEAAVREALLQKNAVITQLTDSEYEAFRQVCEQIWYSYRDGRYIDLIDRIVAVGYLQKLPEQGGEIYESESE